MMGCWMWPYLRSCGYAYATIPAGMAKPRPWLPPDEERMNVLMPTRSPSASTSAPPLLPGSIGVSVWTYTSGPIGIGLPCHGAHDAHGHRVAQALRASDGEDDFALLRGSGFGNGQGRQAVRLDLNHGEIDFRCNPDGARVVAFSLPGLLGGRGAFGSWLRRDKNFDLLRSVQDVGVGYDIAFGIDNHSRTNGALPSDDHAGLTAFVLRGGSVAGDDNLNDSGGYTLNQELRWSRSTDAARQELWRPRDSGRRQCARMPAGQRPREARSTCRPWTKAQSLLIGDS